MYGRTQYNRPSRFVEEIEQDLLQSLEKELSRKGQLLPFSPKSFQTNVYPTSSVHCFVETNHDCSRQSMASGEKVNHKNGVGTIVRTTGAAQDLELDVAFPQQGVKRLLAAFAPIENYKEESKWLCHQLKFNNERKN